MAVCRTCESTFTPEAGLASKYPDWTPPDCPDCFRGGKRAVRVTQGGLFDGTPPKNDPQSGVFTDGSASPNPGPGGWGVVHVENGNVVAEACGGESDTTNNRMELRAIQEALVLLSPGTKATIHTDSKLAVQTLNEWAAGWARRGWKRKTGPVENLDLVRPLHEALAERPEVSVVWIRAHVGHRWNEYADALANRGRQQDSAG